MLIPLLSVCALAIAVGVVLAFLQVRRKGLHERDNGVNEALVKHPILSHPYLYAYVLFPIAILVGVVIWMYYIGF